ncbi:MAG: class I SAM-dependent methyltransferase [Syntrophobacterales bacterium]|jgi:predicted O-methyltransferase YrrM|nr:class I SAM-dependent methyltransferase [Syntrophobacterales bacterium]
MNKPSLRKTWVIIPLLAALGLSLGAVNPALAQCGGRDILAKNESEKKILSVLDDIRVGPCTDEMHGRLLRILAENAKAKNVVEIGTGNGYSALWLCLGLKTTGGKLITHEIEHKQVLLARANFKRAGVEDLVTVVEGDARETVTQLKEPIDILFMDAEGDNMDYLNQLLPLVRPGGLILADNMRKPKPDPRVHRGHHHESKPRNHLLKHAIHGDQPNDQERLRNPTRMAARGQMISK